MIREIEPSLIGDDATRIEAMTIKLAGIFTYTGTRGAVSALISAIDIALWDIRGQALGVPIYDLLGGSGARNDSALHPLRLRGND